MVYHNLRDTLFIVREKLDLFMLFICVYRSGCRRVHRGGAVTLCLAHAPFSLLSTPLPHSSTTNPRIVTT